LKDWLTKSFSGTCADPSLGTTTIVVNATISGAKQYKGTLTFDVVIE
jgi:hypothetical protein